MNEHKDLFTLDKQHVNQQKSYLVGIGMCEGSVVLARAAVCGPVLEHGGGGRGFIQQTTLCKQRTERSHI